jgi:hypothetical protein
MPGNDGSARTTSYTVTASPGDASATVSGAAQSATISGLKAATEYTFTVTATSSAGTGAPSAATLAIRPIVSTAIAPTVRTSVNYGQPLHISARLARTDTHAGVAGRTVTVYRRLHGATTWQQQATFVTGSTGAGGLTLRPKRSIDLMLSFAGGGGYRKRSVITTTLVRPVATATLAAPSVRHGHRVALNGTVTPVLAGQQLTRQTFAGGQWVSTGTTTVSATGTYTFVLHPSKKNPRRLFRVVVPAADGRAFARSPVVSLKVT